MAAANPYLEDAPSATNPYLELGDNPYLKLGAEAPAEPALDVLRSPTARETAYGYLHKLGEQFAPLGKLIGELSRAPVQLPTAKISEDGRVLLQPPSLTPKTSETLGATLPMPPEITTPLALAGVLPKTAKEAAVGLYNAGVGFANFMLSPAGVATAGAAQAPAAVQASVSAYYGGTMAYHLPEIARQAGDAFGKGDIAKAVELTASGIGSLVLSGVLGGKAVAEARVALRPKPAPVQPPPIPPAEQLAAKVEANKELLPLTAKVVEETVKPVTPDITPAESARVERINTALEQQRETTPEPAKESVPVKTALPAESEVTTTSGQAGVKPPELKVGDEQVIMQVPSVLANTQTIGGVKWDLFNGAKLKENRAAVRVIDVESGEVLQLKQFPTYDTAEAHYNSETAKAKTFEQPAAKEAVAPVAEAKMQAEVSKVAATEGKRSAKEIKADLIEEIQQRLQAAPAEAKSGDTVTIEIPDDGTFTVPNTVEALSGLLERAKKIKTDAGKPTGVPSKAIKQSGEAIRRSSEERIKTEDAARIEAERLAKVEAQRKAIKLFDDPALEKHFQEWLDNIVHREDRAEVSTLIHAFLKNHPEALGRNGWTEIRRMAEKDEISQEIAKSETAHSPEPPTPKYSTGEKVIVGHEGWEREGTIAASGPPGKWFVKTNLGEVAYDEASIRPAKPARATAGEGQRPGPGAMTAGELLPEEAFITSIKNAWTDADAARFGLEPVERGERRHWRDTVIPEAEAEILNNPQAAEGIMQKVKADPNYRMQDVETAILLQRKADIINEINRAKKRLDEAREIKHVENEITEMVRINDLSDSLQKIREVSKDAGTPLGQALAARKMLMREDYSLATLVARKASALGRPLEPAELAKIEALEAKIADLEAKLKAGEEAKSQEGRKGQEGQTHDETVKAARRAKAKGEPVDSVTEGQNIIDRMKKRVEEGDTAEDLYAFVQKLHENLQRQALDQQGTPLSRVEVVDAIHNILTKDLGLNLPKEFTGTERVQNTSDLISGIGRPYDAKLTTDTAKLAKMDVREQEQKIGKINRYLQKLNAPKTGPPRKKSSAEARQLEKEGRKLAREMGIRVTDPATQLANSLSAIKTRLRNEIEEIDLAIASKKPLVKKDGGVAYDAEATALRAQRDAKKADYDALFPKEPLTEAEQIQRAGKVLDRQIAEVERQLKSGEIFPPGRQPKPELRSAALDAQRSRLEALKQERAYARDLIQPKPEIKSSEELALQGWRTRTTHRIADLQERIAKGDFAARKRQPVQPTTTADLALKAELKKIKDEFDIGVNKDRLANRTRAAKVWDGVKRTLGSPRQLMSSWDLSAVLRQGGFIAFGHPVRAGKALKPMVDALRSDDRARVEEQKIFDRDNYKNGLYQRAKLYLAPLEGMKPSRAEEVFIPSYAERVLGVQASQRAYVTFLNRLRTDSFDAMVAGFAKRGRGLTDIELRAIANYVNVATGRGNLPGRLAASAEGLSLAFFSPRLVSSRFELLFSPLAGFRQGGPTSARVRLQVAEEYARLALGLSVVYGLGAWAGAEIEIDPRSPDFGKLKFGNTRVDPLMGLAQHTVIIVRESKGEKMTGKGDIVPLSGKKPGEPSPFHLGADWLRTKFSPVLGMGVSIREGTYPGGDPVTPLSVPLSFLPLAWQDVLSVMEEQGVPRGAAIEILSLLGMGVQNYDEQRKVR